MIGSIIALSLSLAVPVYALAAIRQRSEVREAWAALALSLIPAAMLFSGFTPRLICG